MRPISTALKNSLQARDDRAKQFKTARNRAELEAAEEGHRLQERADFDGVVKDHNVDVSGSNPSGLYELCGMSTRIDLLSFVGLT